MQLLEKCKELSTKKLEAHPERLLHTIGVVEMATYLAKIYGVDEIKAQIAAYMHDYCKYDDVYLAKDLLNEDDLAECEKYSFLYHAYMAAEYFKKYVSHDEEIYLAIRNHVFGRVNMTKLEEIIMISDYTEKNRKYKDCIHCRELIFEGKIDEAIYQSLLNTINHCINKNEEPHPVQIAVCRQIKERIL